MQTLVEPEEEPDGTDTGRLRYVRLLGVAVRVEDALVFMTTAGEEGWPEGEDYLQLGRELPGKGFPVSAGEVLRRWAHDSSSVTPIDEFVDAIVSFCLHPSWFRPTMRLRAIIDDYLFPLLASFLGDLDLAELQGAAHAEGLQQKYDVLNDVLRNKRTSQLVAALRASVDTHDAAQPWTLVPRRLEALPRFYPSHCALTDARQEYMWPTRWLVEAC